MEVVAQVKAIDRLDFRRSADMLLISDENIEFISTDRMSDTSLQGKAYPDAGGWIDVLRSSEHGLIAILPLLLLWLGRGKSMRIKRQDGTLVELKNISEKTCSRILEALLTMEDDQDDEDTQARIRGKKR